MHGENLRKFTEIRAAGSRARHASISSQPKVQYTLLEYIPAATTRRRGRASNHARAQDDGLDECPAERPGVARHTLIEAR